MKKLIPGFITIAICLLIVICGCKKDTEEDCDEPAGYYKLNSLLTGSGWQYVPYYTGSGVTRRATISGELSINCQNICTASERSGMVEYSDIWREYTWYHANKVECKLVNDTTICIWDKLSSKWDTGYYSTGNYIKIWRRRYVLKTQ